MSASDDVAGMIFEALISHGLQAERREDYVRLPGPELIFQASVDVAETGVAHLSVGATSPTMDRRAIWFDSAGWGEGRDAAVSNAFAKFLLCPFHPILGALGGHSCEHDNWERWTTLPREGCEPQTWAVIDSPILSQGAAEGTDYRPLADGLKDAFLAADLPPNAIHWVDLFSAWLKGERTAHVLLDGAPWPAGEAALDGWAYPPADHPQEEYVSARYFFIATPRRASPPDTRNGAEA